MYAIHQLSFFLHVACGACALLLFWVPVFTRKGNLDHKRFGRYFAHAMYLVAGSGFIMSGLDLLFPLAAHARGVTLDESEAMRASVEVRGFAMFLFSLSILVFVSTRQGWLAILHKADRTALRTPVHLGLCTSLVAVGVALFVTGLVTDTLLYLIFAVLEIFAGINMLRYVLKAELQAKEWWIEHLNGLIGSGIGAYTAFFVFGGSRIFASLLGAPYENVAIVFWIAPGVIGSIAIALLSRKYRIRFSGSWATSRARFRTDLVR